MITSLCGDWTLKSHDIASVFFYIIIGAAVKCHQCFVLHSQTPISSRYPCTDGNTPVSKVYSPFTEETTICKTGNKYWLFFHGNKYSCFVLSCCSRVIAEVNWFGFLASLKVISFLLTHLIDLHHFSFRLS